ncbi:hypothetical protein ACQEVB_20370 [Pseudonocardia sp. CA-107938]|uniref:hypothetical protein n=1 Tax=Pseudonocardia sp. CA-107938 TaxID=3240021 RepID=UPI003D927267
MTVELAVALLALLVGLFALVALVAVYARVRALEAGRADGVSGYASLLGTPAPAVAPFAGQRVSVVAVLDADCALCHEVLATLSAMAGPDHRSVAVCDRAGFAPAPGVDIITDPAVRAELFEGYSPTVLAVDAAGRIRSRTFVYADTDRVELVTGLLARTERAAA